MIQIIFIFVSSCEKNSVLKIQKLIVNHKSQLKFNNEMGYHRVSHRCWEHGGALPPPLLGGQGRGLFKIWWGGGGGWWLSQNMGGAWGGLKMLSKINCEGDHLIVKLAAISLHAWKFTKNELLHTYFQRILAIF